MPELRDVLDHYPPPLLAVSNPAAACVWCSRGRIRSGTLRRRSRLGRSHQRIGAVTAASRAADGASSYLTFASLIEGRASGEEDKVTLSFLRCDGVRLVNTKQQEVI
jgi:hypothetical protein